MGLINKTQEEYYLGPDGLWNSHDEDYGGYQFVPINDIINTFMVAYVGEDKNIRIRWLSYSRYSNVSSSGRNGITN